MDCRWNSTKPRKERFAFATGAGSHRYRRSRESVRSAIEVEQGHTLARFQLIVVIHLFPSDQRMKSNFGANEVPLYAFKPDIQELEVAQPIKITP